MKTFKLFLLFVVFSAISLISNSQPVKFEKGIRVGYTASSMAGIEDQLGEIESVSARHGIHFGAFGGLKLPLVSIQLEAMLTPQGVNTVSTSNEEGSVKLSYLNIPLIARLRLGPVNFHTGIQYGVLLNARINDVAVDGFYDSEIAIPLGVGLSISKLIFDVRYNIGISDVDQTGAATVANAAFLATAGLRF